MTIKQDSVVAMHYTLRDDEGEVIDSSDGGEPLAYLHGHSNIVPGLENELTGKAVGDKIEVKVDAQNGYGEQHLELIQTVPLSAFEGVDEVKPGMQFQAETAAGPRPVVVTNVTDSEVTVDGNHPLAGHTRHFSGEVRERRDASAEELEHGHVHGPQGHNH